VRLGGFSEFSSYDEQVFDLYESILIQVSVSARVIYMVTLHFVDIAYS